MPSQSTIQDITDAIGGIDAELGGIDERRAELHRQRRALVVALEFFGGAADGAPDSATTPAERSVPGIEIPNAIHAILEESGALHRQDIHARLAVRGVKIGGQNPVNSMGAYLSRDPRFQSLGGGLWDLAQPPATETDNHPNNPQDDEGEEDVPW